MDTTPPALSTQAPSTSQALTDSPPNTTLDVLDAIAAGSVSSRANYLYACFFTVGLASACFLLYAFIQSSKTPRGGVARVDVLLWAFCSSQLLLLLFSLSSLVHRPHYLVTTHLGCAALAFFVNMASFCGLLLLVLMGYVLTFDPPTHTMLWRPGACVALVVLASVLVSVVLGGIRGLAMGQDLWRKGEICVIDPAEAGLSYAVAKLCMGFVFPYVLLVVILTGGCVRQWKSSGRFLSGSEEGPVFLSVATVMFACQLFYGVVLVRGAGLGTRWGLSPAEKVFLSVAECVLFSGSCVCLLLVLLLHRPSRGSLQGGISQIRDCCSSRQTHRHVMAPQVEIADMHDY